MLTWKLTNPVIYFVNNHRSPQHFLPSFVCLNKVGDELRIKIEKCETDDYYNETMFKVEDNKQWIEQLNNTFEIKTNPNSIENSYNCSVINHSGAQKIINSDAYNVTEEKVKVETSETDYYYQEAVIKIDEQNEDTPEQFTEVIVEKIKPTYVVKSYNSCVKAQNGPQKNINWNKYNTGESCAETIATVKVGEEMSGYDDFEPTTTMKKNHRESQLTLNQRLQTGEKRYSCDLCLKTYTRNSSLTLHKRVHTGEKNYKCEFCPNSFSNKSHLTTHKHLVHAGEKHFNCDACLKSFSQKSSLLLHKRVHTGETHYKCEFCLNSFSNKFLLATHKLQHVGEKPLNCDVCLKSFSQKSSLLLHKRAHHTGENNHYKCEFCLNSFSNQFQLATHKLQHTGEKPFNCDVCLKCYSQKSSLTLHKRVHAEEKSYKCDFCLKSFSDKSYLSMHKTVHIGEKHYKCDVCLKSFSQKSSLILHRRVHTRNVKFTCPNFHCQLYFSDS
ncbi:zinc finger protein ZFP2-like isoform X2 [Adelges cooleyi]|uniref:zinc finger protein ZFP2-like isoform X2 n=1 Tax=Adelges cooleyi TaxID=133065 RepID=UPI00217F7DC4|nr:zinc finger protein ZFP2-like isoform X2 [Adelges cooleyi]